MGILDRLFKRYPTAASGLCVYAVDGSGLQLPAGTVGEFTAAGFVMTHAAGSFTLRSLSGIPVSALQAVAAAIPGCIPVQASRITRVDTRVDSF
jgi:hypothetical protein